MPPRKTTARKTPARKTPARKTPRGRELVERRRDPTAPVHFEVSQLVTRLVPRAVLDHFIAGYLASGALNGYFEHAGNPFWISGPYAIGPTTIWTVDDTPAFISR